MKQISIIVAVDKQFGIGLNNKLLCHLPADLQYFKKITDGHTIIMGRNTFLSLPKGALPNRRNIVISNIENETFEGCIMAYSIEEAITLMDEKLENFIVGGAMIYQQFLPLATKLYLTHIQHNFEADTFFPEVNPNVWKSLTRQSYHCDEKNKYDMVFEVLQRDDLS